MNELLVDRNTHWKDSVLGINSIGKEKIEDFYIAVLK